MKFLTASFAAIFLLSSAYAFTPPDDFTCQRDDDLVQVSYQKTIAKAGADRAIKAWIFFTDKGFSTLSQYTYKLQETESRLTERARNRRLKVRGPNNLVDFRDIPVNQNYIDQVLSTGVKLRRVLRWFNAVTVEANQDQLSQIAGLPFVGMFKHVSTSYYPDDYVKETGGGGDYPMVSTTLDYGFSLSQLEQINTVVAHELGFAGQGVLVCMMDTGYRQGHDAFQTAINEGRLIAQYDFINNDDNTDYDPDQDVENQPRHGTLTWSTLGGQAEGSLYGPAYQSMFCLSKTEDLTGEHHIEEDNWAAGAEWADSLGASVISASLGYRWLFDLYGEENYTYEDMNGDSTIVTQAADLAVYNGITVVTAQGNNGNLGDGSLLAPADGDSVIAIGAVWDTDEIAAFSAFGPTYDGRIKPEVLARGVNTVCADPSDMNSYTWASGTSLSTPLCGGVAAVLLSAHPNWTPMMVREAMMMTATNNANPDNTHGWGIVDIGRALFYHPEGDIIIEHEPLVYFPSGLENNIIEAVISGGAGINPSEVYLYWRTDETASFEQIPMIVSEIYYFEGIVPGLDEGYLQYYIYAEDIHGSYATYPHGAPDHFFTVYIDSAVFFDSFENGLYYWNTAGFNGNWSITAERSATGNISITDSPYRYYNNDAETFLTSNFSIPLYDADSAAVSFKARYILQSNLDFVYFEVSTDDGVTWEQAGMPINGSSFTFEEISRNLDDYLGNDVRFRFRMTTNSSGTREGIHIDDFRVDWELQVGIADRNPVVPRQFELSQNYPNPFNASTRISFTLGKGGLTQLTIYDILGRTVKTMLSKAMTAGGHDIIWNGKDDFGNHVASGIYLYRLKAENVNLIKRMTLIR